jgi:hypothetical protein
VYTYINIIKIIIFIGEFMARTLATTTAKKRKVIMGAAALGTAGLIG